METREYARIILKTTGGDSVELKDATLIEMTGSPAIQGTEKKRSQCVTIVPWHNVITAWIPSDSP
jgi:hypothetical protein